MYPSLSFPPYSSHTLPRRAPLWLPTRNARPAWSYYRNLHPWLGSLLSVKVTLAPTRSGRGCAVVRARLPSASQQNCTSVHSCDCCLLSGPGVNTNTEQQEQGILISPVCSKHQHSSSLAPKPSQAGCKTWMMTKSLTSAWTKSDSTCNWRHLLSLCAFTSCPTQ